jgi:hypothetical protein
LVREVKLEIVPSNFISWYFRSLENMTRPDL